MFAAKRGFRDDELQNGDKTGGLQDGARPGEDRRLDHGKRKDGGCGIRDELRVRERKSSSDTMLGISNLYSRGVKDHNI
jgi:hypothetical protein